ncbi:MAG: nucleotide sugar dehydrogenase, partial [Leptospiraceae bacterium]|nr:nucleotide sugar dehydrogenase [Leptospiraceae bacterium]
MKKKEIESDGKICVMGLGYVGLTLAVTLADVGFDVYGIEIRDDILEKLKNGEAHFYEPKLNEKLKKVIKKNRFCFFEHIPSDKTMDVFIITVGTPLGKDGKPRMDMIQHVTEEIAANIKPGNLVIMRSTLKLGITRHLVMPILEQTGKEFDLAFCPERTLEGNAMQELRYLPQIVG